MAAQNVNRVSVAVHSIAYSISIHKSPRTLQLNVIRSQSADDGHSSVGKGCECDIANKNLVAERPSIHVVGAFTGVNAICALDCGIAWIITPNPISPGIVTTSPDVVVASTAHDIMQVSVRWTGVIADNVVIALFAEHSFVARAPENGVVFTSSNQTRLCCYNSRWRGRAETPYCRRRHCRK